MSRVYWECFAFDERSVNSVRSFRATAIDTSACKREYADLSDEKVASDMIYSE